MNACQLCNKPSKTRSTILGKLVCLSCRRKYWKSIKVCASCGRLPLATTTYCCVCRNSIIESAKKRRYLDKNAAFNHYGNSCAYCKESIQDFLTIDHMDDSGHIHRRAQNGKNSGFDVYKWLRLHHYPDGYQTLCYNCNCAKAIYGKDEVLKAINSIS